MLAQTSPSAFSPAYLYLRDTNVSADVLRQVDHISVLCQRHDEASQGLRVKAIHGVALLPLLPLRKEATQPQEAEQDPHDARLVQVVGDSPGQRQRAGQLVEHLRLLAAPLSGCVPGSQLPLLAAAPAAGQQDAEPLSWSFFFIENFILTAIF